MAFRRESLEQDYSLQHSTLALNQVGLHVYMTALMLLPCLSHRYLVFIYHVSALFQEMQDYLDAKHPSLCAVSDGRNSNDGSSSLMGILLKRPTVTIIGIGQERN